MVEEIKEISEEQAESGNILMAGDEEDTVAQNDPSWKLWKAGLCS